MAGSHEITHGGSCHGAFFWIGALCGEEAARILPELPLEAGAQAPGAPRVAGSIAVLGNALECKGRRSQSCAAGNWACGPATASQQALLAPLPALPWAQRGRAAGSTGPWSPTSSAEGALGTTTCSLRACARIAWSPCAGVFLSVVIWG